MLTLWIVLMFAVLGGAWRWLDGRGYGPNWLRMGSCGVLAALALVPTGWWAIPLGAAFAAIWSFRQKNREEWDDMALRWALPFAVFGIVSGLVIGSIHSAAIMTVAGAVVSVLVWAGTHLPSKFTLGRDPAAVTEAAAGALAFGALAWVPFF
jgi:hypothetical protein